MSDQSAGQERVVDRDFKYLMNCVFCPRVTSSKLLGNSTFAEYAEDLLRCSEVVWQVSLDVFDQFSTSTLEILF